MKHDSILRTLTVSILATAFLADFARAETKRPDILWISAEDISPDLGCYDDKLARTPNLDKLASESQARRPDARHAYLLKRLKPDQRHDPDDCADALPPYIPDTPAARKNWAKYYDNISEMDRQAGEVLARLKGRRTRERHARRVLGRPRPGTAAWQTLDLRLGDARSSPPAIPRSDRSRELA